MGMGSQPNRHSRKTGITRGRETGEKKIIARDLSRVVRARRTTIVWHPYPLVTKNIGFCGLHTLVLTG